MAFKSIAKTLQRPVFGLVMLSLTVAIAAHPKDYRLAPALRGGGSSTGGGHIRICFTATAAESARKNVLTATQAPQLGIDVLSGISQNEITRVELLDLIEQPSWRPDLLVALSPFVYKDARDPIENLTQGLYDMAKHLKKSGLSVFDENTMDFQKALYKVATKEDWVPSPTGLALTRDFDPKTSNPDACVYGQVVRQEVMSRQFSTFVYDQRLLPLMLKEEAIALGLHEAIYNLVLNSPNSAQIRNPSVLTRELTFLVLVYLTGRGSFEAIAEGFEAIGYGPFRDMIRPSKRLNHDQLIQYGKCVSSKCVIK